MSALLAALLLAATPPAPTSAPAPAQKAKELAAKKAWEELYLAFSSGDASGIPEAQRRPVSAALLKGCEALLQEDTVMAYSLGERAAVYEPSEGALKCLARSARKTDQRAAAETALRKGMELHTKDGGFGLELGKLLLEEQDTAGAVAVLELVPKRSREAAEAKRLLQQARSRLTQEGSARVEAGRLERELYRPPSSSESVEQASAATGGADLDLTVPALSRESQVDTRRTTLAYQSGVDENGARKRFNSRFDIRYFNNNRDFSQRADYEATIVAALDDAYHTTRLLLGEAREKPVKVVLYTRAEYSTSFGSWMAKWTAGYYWDDAICINSELELTPHNKATLVHEYVHAAVDEMCGNNSKNEIRLPAWFHEGVAEYVEWQYLKTDGPPIPAVAKELQALARTGSLPSLRAMPRDALLNINNRNPQISYAVAALAVRELVRQSGMNRLVPFIKDVCRDGMPFDKALLEHFAKSEADLDQAVRAALPSR